MFERNLHLRDMLEGVLDSMSIAIQLYVDHDQRCELWVSMLRH